MVKNSAAVISIDGEIFFGKRSVPLSLDMCLKH